jgi:hypothetical protein
MTEIEEVAQALESRFRGWIGDFPSVWCTKSAAREFVRMKVPNESRMVQLAIADELYSLWLKR